MIGEYLAQHEEFSTSVLHAYVESMNFSRMRFDVAMLEFLKGFQLPRGALKIEAIIQKFAAWYVFFKLLHFLAYEHFFY